GFAQVVLHPRRADVLFAIVSQATGLEFLLFRSDDAGAHWARQPVDLTHIAFDPQRPGTAFGVGRSKVLLKTTTGVLRATSAVYKSTDDGDTWTEIATVTELGGLGGLILVDPVRPRTLYVTDGAVLVRSTDDGVSWQRLDNPGRVLLLFADASGTL